MLAPAALPGIFFSRPLTDPWALTSPCGRLLVSLGCQADQLSATLQQALSAADQQRLARLFAEGKDYAVEYNWGQRRLEERATAGPEGFTCLIIDISARQPSEALALLAETIPEPVSLINTEHRYLCVNRAWRQVFSHLSEEPVGASLEQIWGREIYTTFLRPLLAQAFAGQQVSDEFWSETGPSEKRCRSLKLYPCQDEGGRIDRVVIVTRDVTELKHTSQALHHSVQSANELRDQVSLTLEVAEIGIWGFEFSSSVVCWDDTMYRIYGHPCNQEITLEQWRELIHPEDQHHLKGFLESQKDSSERQVVHFRIVRQDGAVRFIKAVYGIDLDKDGVARGLMGANVDVTELHEVQEALRQASLTAERANQAKSQFLATMSHEIRTPMNAILGLVHLVRQSELTQRQDDYLQKLEHSARSLLDIINDILDFSKIEAGKLSLESCDFRLSEVLDNLGQLLQVRAKDKPGLEILLSIEADIPDLLRGDPLRLGQVLLNLGGNAVKFTELGEIVIAARCLHREPDSIILEFSVTDTGVGLQPDQLSTLFQPFAQADSSIARKYGGTGLGLSISRQLVDLMGGHIWAESSGSGGARFVFTARFQPGSSEAAAPDRSFPQERNNLKVLIVDDNASARRILEVMVRGFGFQSEATESGEEAVRMAQEEAYGLILMDWRLTGIDGIEAIRRIRSQARGDDPVILLITAYDREDLAEQMVHASIDGLLLKPISESTLYDAVATALHKRDLSEAEGRKPARAAVQAPSQYQARVLVVEDNEINRLVAEEMLGLRGVEVTSASSAQVAIEYLEGQTFDLIFMDVQMPGMDGLEATRRIRHNTKLTQIPIIAMTANAMMGDRERCLQAGMNDYLSKPIDPLALSEILEKYLASASPFAGQATVGRPSNSWLDVRGALDRLGGNTRLYLKLLAKFQEQHQHAVPSIAEFLSKNNPIAARGLAHTLKGTAANLGMTRLSAQAQRMESAIKSQEPDLASLLAELQHEMDQVLQSIGEVHQLAPPFQPADASVAQELWVRLKELSGLLQVDIGRAIALSESLLGQYAGHRHFAALEELHCLLQEFANEEAEELVSRLIHDLQACGDVVGRPQNA